MRMPFGRFKGLAVEDLPTDYLEWLIDTVQLRSRLRAAVHVNTAGAAKRRPPAVERRLSQFKSDRKKCQSHAEFSTWVIARSPANPIRTLAGSRKRWSS